MAPDQCVFVILSSGLYVDKGSGGMTKYESCAASKLDSFRDPDPIQEEDPIKEKPRQWENGKRRKHWEMGAK